MWIVGTHLQVSSALLPASKRSVWWYASDPTFSLRIVLREIIPQMLLGTWTQVIQPVVSHCTDWTIPIQNASNLRNLLYRHWKDFQVNRVSIVEITKFECIRVYLLSDWDLMKRRNDFVGGRREEIHRCQSKEKWSVRRKTEMEYMCQNFCWEMFFATLGAENTIRLLL